MTHPFQKTKKLISLLSILLLLPCSTQSMYHGNFTQMLYEGMDYEKIFVTPDFIVGNVLVKTQVNSIDF